MIDVKKMVRRILAALQELRRGVRADDHYTPEGLETQRGRRQILLVALNAQADELLNFDNEPPSTNRSGRRA